MARAISSLIDFDLVEASREDLVYRPWSLDGGRVERRPISDALPGMDVGIAWRQSYRFDAAESRFRDFLISAIDE